MWCPREDHTAGRRYEDGLRKDPAVTIVAVHDRGCYHRRAGFRSFHARRLTSSEDWEASKPYLSPARPHGIPSPFEISPWSLQSPRANRPMRDCDLRTGDSGSSQSRKCCISIAEGSSSLHFLYTAMLALPIRHTSPLNSPHAPSLQNQTWSPAE